MPDPVTEQDAVVVHGVLVRLLCLEVLQPPGVQLLEDGKPGGVHLKGCELVHDLVKEDSLLITVALHGQCDPALGVCQAVADTREFSGVRIPGKSS